MNREDITRMAREAGFVGMDGDHGALRRFAALVAAAEREACAKVCEGMKPSEATFDRRFFIACTLNANAIRARSK